MVAAVSPAGSINCRRHALPQFLRLGLIGVQPDTCERHASHRPPNNPESALAYENGRTDLTITGTTPGWDIRAPTSMKSSSSRWMPSIAIGVAQTNAIFRTRYKPSSLGFIALFHHSLFSAPRPRPVLWRGLLHPACDQFQPRSSRGSPVQEKATAMRRSGPRSTQKSASNLIDDSAMAVVEEPGSNVIGTTGSEVTGSAKRAPASRLFCR